jgi:predicted RNase H-like nuclease (RuvC/YqgF family)
VSDTPKTDAAVEWATCRPGPISSIAEFARSLERENAALRGALDAATTSLCTISKHYREKVEKLECENAALRHSEENLAATVRGLEFELEKAEKATAMLRGTVEALGDANDRLTIEISGLRKEVRRE